MELPDKIRYDSIVVVFARPNSEDLARPYYGNKAYKSRPNGVAKPDRPERPPVRPAKPARPPFATTKYDAWFFLEEYFKSLLYNYLLLFFITKQIAAT